MPDAQAVIAARWAKELDKLKDADIDSLRREDELGQTLSFTQAVDDIKVIRQLSSALSIQDPQFEPQRLTREIATHLATVIQLTDKV